LSSEKVIFLNIFKSTLDLELLGGLDEALESNDALRTDGIVEVIVELVHHRIRLCVILGLECYMTISHEHGTINMTI